MTYARKMAEECYEELKARSNDGRVPHIEACILAVIEHCAKEADATEDLHGISRLIAARIRALSAPQGKDGK